MFSDDSQSVGHSTSWHLATGTHNTLTTPLFYPPDREDIIITMSQLRSLHAGERPESRVASVAHPRLPGVKCWTWPSQVLEQSLGIRRCHLAITSERGGTWLSPHIQCWWGKEAAETPQPLFSDHSSFLYSSCLTGFQRDSVQS